MDKLYFVYLLSNCRRGVLYVGVTNDLVRRISEHKAKRVPGFTNIHGISNLVYFEEHASIVQAREREHVLKRWRRDWKFKLVEENNPEWNDLSDRLAF